MWAIIYYTLFRGVRRGIELIIKIFMPLLLILMVIFVFRAVTLPGAAVGLDHLLTPQFPKIIPPLFGGDNAAWYKVWVAAYGQIFFSLSISFAVMITYGSYLHKNRDVNNSSFIMAFSTRLVL